MSDLVVGDWYVLRGQGPMRLEENATPEFPTRCFSGLGGNPYWARVAEVLFVVDRAYWERFKREAAGRVLLAAKGPAELEAWLAVRWPES